MLYTIKNIVLMANQAQGNHQVVANSLKEVADLVQKYVAIGFAAAAGLLALISGLLALYAMFKASKANTDQERQDEFKKVKWSAFFLLILLAFWAFISAVVGIVQLAAGNAIR